MMALWTSAAISNRFPTSTAYSQASLIWFKSNTWSQYLQSSLTSDSRILGRVEYRTYSVLVSLIYKQNWFLPQFRCIVRSTQQTNSFWAKQIISELCLHDYHTVINWFSAIAVYKTNNELVSSGNCLLIMHCFSVLIISLYPSRQREKRSQIHFL